MAREELISSAVCIAISRFSSGECRLLTEAIACQVSCQFGLGSTAHSKTNYRLAKSQSSKILLSPLHLWIRRSHFSNPRISHRRRLALRFPELAKTHLQELFHLHPAIAVGILRCK